MNKVNNLRALGVLAFVLSAVCVVGIAKAATVTVTGTNPTQNTDDTTIPATGPGSLVTLRFEYGTCSAPNVFGTKAGEVTRAAGAPGSNFSQVFNFNPGTTCVRVMVSNTFGTESAPSNVTSSVVAPPTPKPPTLAAIAPQVYDVRPNEQTFAFDRGRQVGTIKLGAACDEDRNTDADYYALERPSRVQLSRNPRSTALVARCG